MLTTIYIPHSILLIAIAALLTFILRAIPFLLFGGSRKMPALVKKITNYLPPAIMTILVIYCLKDSIYALVGMNTCSTLIAAIVVIALHLWKRNTLLSIFGSTAVYMICIRLLPLIWK